MIAQYVRFLDKQGVVHWAVLNDGEIRTIQNAPWIDRSQTGESHILADVQLMGPAEPTKILAFGYNYKDLFKDKAARVGNNEPSYTEENFEPVVFLKAPNTLAASGEKIVIPSWAPEVWCEVELAIVIGKKIKNVKTIEDAREAIFGYTIANDVSALNIFGRDWHLARSKSLDGFCPAGPVLVSGINVEQNSIRLKINGKTTQQSTTKNRILNSIESVLFASKIMTLNPGDMVITGTPLGARQSLVTKGDTVEATIDGLGTLKNFFVGESHVEDRNS